MININKILKSSSLENVKLLSYFHQGYLELIEGIKRWRLSYLMGSNDIRRRYARSKFGQVWIMLSSAISITAMGACWSILWQQSIFDMLPYIAIGILSWRFLTVSIIESTTVLSASHHLFRNQYLPFSVIINATIYKNLIEFLLNMIYPLMFLRTFKTLYFNDLVLSVIGIVYLIIFTTSLCFVFSILCSRYRDLIQLVASGIELLMFFTPILWKPQVLPENLFFLIDINPIAAFISVVRDPLLHNLPNLSLWSTINYSIFVSVAISLYVIGVSRNKIIYWI